RIIHPLLAILTSAYLITVNRYLTQLYTDASIKRTVNVIYLLVGTQLIAGVVNVSLLAPLWMQVVHLILADSLWIAIVIVTTEIVWQPPVAAR
ncbi:MAG TPA: COX15/CtaA family protein, partial [Anaerolineae bacterium]